VAVPIWAIWGRGTGHRPPIVARPQILPAPKFSRTLDTLWSIYSKIGTGGERREGEGREGKGGKWRGQGAKYFGLEPPLARTSPSVSVVGQSRPPSRLGSTTYLARVCTPLPHRASVLHSVHVVHSLSWQSRAHGTKHISSMNSAQCQAYTVASLRFSAPWGRSIIKCAL